MASEVEICNRALQKLGAKRITSLTEDSVNARSVNACYAILRDAELRRHPWNFAIDRAQLAADVTAPLFGKENSFPLPANYLGPIPPYPEYNVNNRDWQIEGGKIYTNDAAPLNFRYVKQVTDPNLMDPLFREALSARIALEICEELMDSNAKVATVAEMYKEAINEAKKLNAFEKIASKPPEDEWVTVRQ